MQQTRSDDANENIVYAYEPDQSLRKLIGDAIPIANIFTKEKIAKCQQLVDEAKQSFFETAQADIDKINQIVNNSDYAGNYNELCKQIYQHACNIKGQAEIFGFPLISSLCKHLIEYSQAGNTRKQLTDKDILLIKQLVKALEKSFTDKIIDSGREIEKELMFLVDKAQK